MQQPDVLADEPVRFSVVGCSPGESVTITAAWTVAGKPVRSEARFTAASTGIVEPGRHASIGGSYIGVEPHGLWWSIGLSHASLASQTLDPWTPGCGS